MVAGPRVYHHGRRSGFPAHAWLDRSAMRTCILVQFAILYGQWLSQEPEKHILLLLQSMRVHGDRRSQELDRCIFAWMSPSDLFASNPGHACPLHIFDLFDSGPVSAPFQLGQIFHGESFVHISGRTRKCRHPSDHFWFRKIQFPSVHCNDLVFVQSVSEHLKDPHCPYPI